VTDQLKGAVASPKRLRFTLGSALIAILVIALVLGVVGSRWREQQRASAIHDQLVIQNDVTSDIFNRAQQELVPPGTPMFSSSRGGGSSYDNWHESMGLIAAPHRDLIGLEVEGSTSQGELDPIRIITKTKGELNPELLRRLTQEYAKRKWRYVVQPFVATFAVDHDYPFP
jgi:hypothetical protein